MSVTSGHSFPADAAGKAILGAMWTTVDHDAPANGRTQGEQLIDATAALGITTEPVPGAREIFEGPDDPDGARLPEDPDPVAPEQLMAAIGGDTWLKNRAAELIAIAAFTDGRVEVDRVRHVLAYANELKVHAPWTQVLSDLVAGLGDKAMHEMVILNTETFPGLAPPGETPNLLPYTGRSDADKRLYSRFVDLEGYPKDTYGHQFWVHFRRHGFRFPGQDGAFNGAFAVPHDGLHVLTGYSTSMQGEVLVSTFTGRMHRTNALSAHLLPVIFEWHMGREVNGIGARHGSMDPWKFVVSWRRGEDSDYDVLNPKWSFWDVAGLPIADVRRRYGIAPLPEQYAASGVEIIVSSEADPTVK